MRIRDYDELAERLCGYLGCEPEGKSLRTLFERAESKCAEEWVHTSFLLTGIKNHFFMDEPIETQEVSPVRLDRSIATLTAAAKRPPTIESTGPLSQLEALQ